MKAVGVAAAIFGMIGAVAAQTTCCPETYILEATFTPTPTSGYARRLDDSAPKRALQTADPACDTARTDLAAQFPAQPAAPADPEWMVKGGPSVVEPVLTRAMADLATDASYWQDSTGTEIPEASKTRVVAIHVSGTPDFSTAWATPTAATCDDGTTCVTCEAPGASPDAKWSAAAIPAYLDAKETYVILLAPAADKAAWSTLFDQGSGGAYPANAGDCSLATPAATCKIFVTEDTSDVNTDVLTVLTADNPTDYPATCTPCGAAAPTTGPTGAPPTTAPGGGNPPPTTAPGGGNPPPTTTTTTTGEASSAARVFAGVVPVATAALLALVL